MSLDKEKVTVRIMQREFTVSCPKEESQSLVAAALYLDKQMRAVSKGAQVLGVDRCAIMAGLNISHELLILRGAAHDNTPLNSRLESLHQQIDEAVASIETAS